MHDPPSSYAKNLFVFVLEEQKPEKGEKSTNGKGRKRGVRERRNSYQRIYKC